MDSKHAEKLLQFQSAAGRQRCPYVVPVKVYVVLLSHTFPTSIWSGPCKIRQDQRGSQVWPTKQGVVYGTLYEIDYDMARSYNDFRGWCNVVHSIIYRQYAQLIPVQMLSDQTLTCPCVLHKLKDKCGLCSGTQQIKRDIYWIPEVKHVGPSQHGMIPHMNQDVCWNEWYRVESQVYQPLIHSPPNTFVFMTSEHKGYILSWEEPTRKQAVLIQYKDKQRKSVHLGPDFGSWVQDREPHMNPRSHFILPAASVQEVCQRDRMVAEPMDTVEAGQWGHFANRDRYHAGWLHDPMPKDFLLEILNPSKHSRKASDMYLYTFHLEFQVEQAAEAKGIADTWMDYLDGLLVPKSILAWYRWSGTSIYRISCTNRAFSLGDCKKCLLLCHLKQPDVPLVDLYGATLSQRAPRWWNYHVHSTRPEVKIYMEQVICMNQHFTLTPSNTYKGTIKCCREPPRFVDQILHPVVWKNQERPEEEEIPPPTVVTKYYLLSHGVTRVYSLTYGPASQGLPKLAFPRFRKKKEEDLKEEDPKRKSLKKIRTNEAPKKRKVSD